MTILELEVAVGAAAVDAETASDAAARKAAGAALRAAESALTKAREDLSRAAERERLARQTRTARDRLAAEERSRRQHVELMARQRHPEPGPVEFVAAASFSFGDRGYRPGDVIAPPAEHVATLLHRKLVSPMPSPGSVVVARRTCSLGEFRLVRGEPAPAEIGPELVAIGVARGVLEVLR